jgi:small-conductance mechanosensitive channel
VLISQLNFAIFEKLKQHSVRIPFPQRDVHVKVDGRQTFQDLQSLEALPTAEAKSSKPGKGPQN